MIELYQKDNKDSKDKSLFYKIIRGLLMLFSGIMMFYYLLGIVNYILSGPSITLIDDLTTEFVVQTVLLGLGLFYLVLAWFKHIAYSMVAILFTFLYIIYSSIIQDDYTIGFLSIAMICDAVGFLILGLGRRYRKKKEFDINSEPLIDEIQGPDIFNFRV